MNHCERMSIQAWGEKISPLSLVTAYLLLFAPSFLPLPVGTSLGAGFTSSEIAQSTLSVDCVNWRIKGICLRLKCGFFGCKVISVPWVEHRLPDLVVSSYNQPGESPWVEAKLISRPLTAVASSLTQSRVGIAIGGAHGSTTKPASSLERRPSIENLRFKEVSIIGNPIGQKFLNWANQTFPVFCSSEVVPMQPYFQSEMDLLAWRSGLTEQLYPDSWNPGSRPIGPAHQSWANIYPRQGYVHQHHDVLAGAVAAQRAVDIATRADQPHIYQQVPGIRSSHEQTDQWQMLHPRLEQRCESFGQDPYYWKGRENNSGDSEEGYGWVYWPLHDCCPGPGWLISRIAF